MKSVLCQLIIVFTLVSGLISFTSSAQAYAPYTTHCAWVKGHWYKGHWYPAHKKCWRSRYTHCKWIPAHWYHGVHYSGHNHCW